MLLAAAAQRAPQPQRSPRSGSLSRRASRQWASVRRAPARSVPQRTLLPPSCLASTLSITQQGSRAGATRPWRHITNICIKGRVRRRLAGN